MIRPVSLSCQPERHKAYHKAALGYALMCVTRAAEIIFYTETADGNYSMTSLNRERFLDDIRSYPKGI